MKEGGSNRPLQYAGKRDRRLTGKVWRGKVSFIFPIWQPLCWAQSSMSPIVLYELQCAFPHPRRPQKFDTTHIVRRVMAAAAAACRCFRPLLNLLPLPPPPSTCISLAPLLFLLWNTALFLFYYCFVITLIRLLYTRTPYYSKVLGGHYFEEKKKSVTLESNNSNA